MDTKKRLHIIRNYDTAPYHMDGNRIEPAWLFRTGKMKWRYGELTIVADFTPKVRPGGPRIQILRRQHAHALRICKCLFVTIFLN